MTEEIKKDPTQSKDLEDNYFEQIRALFENAKKRIPKILLHTHLQAASGDILKPDKYNPMKVRGLLDDIWDEEVLQPAKQIILDETQLAYKHGAQFGALHLDNLGITSPSGLSPIDKKTIDILRQRDLSELKGITDTNSQFIMRRISDGMLNGDSYKDVTRDLVKSVDSVGIARAELLVRTEVMHAVNLAVQERYTRSGFDEEHQVWLSSDDDRTCEECSGNNGKTIAEIGYGPEEAHDGTGINCRCTVVPAPDVPADEEEEG